MITQSAPLFDAVLIGGGSAALIAGLLCILIPLGIHFGFRAPRVRLQGTPEDLGLPFQSVRIPTARRRSLAAWLIPANDDRTQTNAGSAGSTQRARSSVLILHGWGSNAEQMLPLALPLAMAGFNLLLINARNHGDSDSDTFSSLPRFAEDLEHAIDWLLNEYPNRASGVAVIGHSVGAGAALLSATRHPSINSAISLSAFAHPAEVTARVMAHLPVPKLAVTLVVRYTEWLIGYRFDTIAPVNSIRSVSCPVLLAHGLSDPLVPFSDAEQIHQQRTHDGVQLIALPGAGHAATDKLQEYSGHLVAFLDATLNGVHHAAANRPGSSRPGTAPNKGKAPVPAESLR